MTDPNILYLQAWIPGLAGLDWHLEQIHAKKLDILVVETAMSGKLPLRKCNNNVSPIEFTRICGQIIPTFLLPEDTKAHVRRSLLFYDYEELGVTPLDRAYSAIKEIVLTDMIQVYSSNPALLVPNMIRKYQIPKRYRELAPETVELYPAKLRSIEQKRSYRIK